jgi:hypothetical protein
MSKEDGAARLKEFLDQRRAKRRYLYPRPTAQEGDFPEFAPSLLEEGAHEHAQRFGWANMIKLQRANGLLVAEITERPGLSREVRVWVQLPLKSALILLAQGQPGKPLGTVLDPLDQIRADEALDFDREGNYMGFQPGVNAWAELL